MIKFKAENGFVVIEQNERIIVVRKDEMVDLFIAVFDACLRFCTPEDFARWRDRASLVNQMCDDLISELLAYQREMRGGAQ